MTLLRTIAHYGESGEPKLSAVHSGNMGDIVYSLAAARRLGVDSYLLNVCDDPGLGRRVLTEEMAAFIAPLLLAQPGIRRVSVITAAIRLAAGIGDGMRSNVVSQGLPLEYVDPQAIGVNYVLDRFRLESADRIHLVHAHARAVGVSVTDHLPYVSVPDAKPRSGPIVLSLTARARNLPGSFFAAVLKGMGEVLLVGSPADRTSFDGIEGRFLACRDALELARTIAGARLFIGSQSMPAAIADGLKVPRLIDVPKYPVVGFPLGPEGFLLPGELGAARRLVRALLDGHPPEQAINFSSPAKPSAAAQRTVTASLYWRFADGDYDTDRRTSWTYSAADFFQLLRCNLPALRRPPAALRLHLGDRVGIWCLERLLIRPANGEPPWRLPEAARARSIFGASQLPSRKSRITAVQTDPTGWIELPIPDRILGALRTGGQIELEVRWLSELEAIEALGDALTQLGTREAAIKQKMHEVAQKDSQLAQKDNELARRSGELDSLRLSTSWRVTAPLRSTIRLLRAVRRKRKRAAPVVLGPDGSAARDHDSSFRQLAELPGAPPFPLALRFHYRRLIAGGAQIDGKLLVAADRGLLSAIDDELEELANLRRARLALTPPTPDSIAKLSIIVCVHNALADVTRCLETLVQTGDPQGAELILVDDGSATETAEFLRRFAEIHAARLIRNDTALGYTGAANVGLAAMSGDIAILLNSDTLPTEGWLDAILACARFDRRIGIIGVLSNTASWQSVPTIFDENGDWAENPLPPGISLEQFSILLRRHAPVKHPLLPFVNGFCFAIKRRLMDEIGRFDPEFANYGEENDYCMRAARRGWLGAIAADAYVYHAQSRSYSPERRQELVERSDRRLVDRHNGGRVGVLAESCRDSLELVSVRAVIGAAIERAKLLREGLARFGGLRIVFLLPAVDGGGCAVVLQEARALARMGILVEIVNLEDHREAFIAQNNLHDCSMNLTFLAKDDSVPDYLRRQAAAIDLVVCTHNSTVSSVAELAPDERPFQVAYYVQDYEPFFYPEGSEAHSVARASYTLLPDMRRVTKTRWNARQVKENAGTDCTIIGPSVDLDLFRPRAEKGRYGGTGKLSIAAMIRPSTPRRAPQASYDLLRELADEHGNDVEIYSFGCTHDELRDRIVGPSPRVRHLGLLDREEMADLLGLLDIFLDLSLFQAMGATVIEAMASGCAVLAPSESGCADFALHRENALLVDCRDGAAVRRELAGLVANRDLRERLQRNAIAAAARHAPERAALSLLEAAAITRRRRQGEDLHFDAVDA